MRTICLSRFRLFVINTLLSFTVSALSCQASIWNKNVASISFTPKVTIRIEKCDKPTYLSPAELQELTNSLTGPVRDLFTDNDLADRAAAYFGVTSKGIMRDQIVVLRFAEDKNRYVKFMYTPNGKLFAVGSG